MENLTEVLPTGLVSFFSKTTTRWVHCHRQSGSGFWLCFYRVITMGVLQLKISRSWILVYLMKFSWSLHERSRKNRKLTMFFNQTNIKFSGQGLKKTSEVFILYGYEVTRKFSSALGQPCCFSAAFARTQLIWLCHSQLVIFLFFWGIYNLFFCGYSYHAVQESLGQVTDHPGFEKQWAMFSWPAVISGLPKWRHYLNMKTLCSLSLWMMTGCLSQPSKYISEKSFNYFTLSHLIFAYLWLVGVWVLSELSRVFWRFIVLRAILPQYL